MTAGSLFLGVGFLSLGATPAKAVPFPDNGLGSAAAVAADITATQRALGRLNTDTEKAAEAYDAGRIALARAQVDARTASVAVKRATAAVNVAVKRRRQLSVAAAGGAGDLTTLAAIVSGDPRTVLDRAGFLDALADRRALAERQLRTARSTLAQVQRTADAAAARQRAQLGTLAAHKKKIENDAASAQALLRRLIARQNELAARARAAALAAQRARDLAAAAAAAAAQAAAGAAAGGLRQELARVGAASASFAAGKVSGAPAPLVLGSGGAPTAVKAAYAELGKPYVWGAAGPETFDCSGLAQWVWAKAGVALPHYTGDQWQTGRQVTRAALVPGDLVFFGDDLYHVGIYVGAGKMIDAPHSGAVVRVEGVWWTQFKGGVRPGPVSARTR